MARRPNTTTSREHDLSEYRAKRDFDRTPEPPPSRGSASRNRRSSSRTSTPPRLSFCVQKHLASHLHYDFRLEFAGVLLSWAVPKGPSLDPADKRLAMRTEDHPLDYGEFQGVIPEGYGAGIVMLWDRGTWQPEPPDADVDKALTKGELKFHLDGFKLKGSWVLVQTGRDKDPRRWLLIKHRDEWSGELDITQVAPLSITTQGDLADILAQENPEIWESNQPARGGDTGRMFRKIIKQAVALRDARENADAGTTAKTRKRTARDSKS